jgi:NitT/TauT family transport system ATP-binding protein
MPATAPILTVQELSAVFPDENGGLQALEGVTFEVCPQEFVCVLGPSGSGKSTLLRILAGLLEPTAGGVRFAGERPPCIGMVFQQATLMPWRSVVANLTLPLELAGVESERTQALAREMVELVGLQGFEAYWPRDLSGGMAQRVAIARALIHDPDLLLLDEPFGSLDALTRENMNLELLRIWEAKQKTVVMVTHSIPEAIFLADRILVMSSRPGRIEATVPVSLPRPRGLEMLYGDEFGALSRQVRQAIH